ncbi:MAG: hypothetical protein LIO94_10455, partial [Clostridiales bacterium]|nr:hypothetical protein [Clostridiales bacterium]
LAAVLAVMLFTQMAAPLTSMAATKTVTAVKSTKASKIPAVKKGTTIIKSTHAKACYYKFTATKAGTYVFTISNLTNTGTTSSDIANGHLYVGNEPTLSAFFAKKYKTQGGKTTTYRICTKASYDSDSSAAKVDRYLKSRTITVSMKKGQTLYFYNYFAANSKTVKYTLNIKMK